MILKVFPFIPPLLRTISYKFFSQVSQKILSKEIRIFLRKNKFTSIKIHLVSRISKREIEKLLPV